jgi:hypothetical protein
VLASSLKFHHRGGGQRYVFSMPEPTADLCKLDLLHSTCIYGTGTVHNGIYELNTVHYISKDDILDLLHIISIEFCKI